jgi:hypothetical protein
MAGVVVGIAGPDVPVLWYLVPFFACYLARLAADAYRRIGEETNLHVFVHVIVSSLVRAVCAFANHGFASLRRVKTLNR